MKKTAQINIRISEQERKQLEKDAFYEKRTKGNLLLWCWGQWRKNKTEKS